MKIPEKNPSAQLERTLLGTQAAKKAKGSGEEKAPESARSSSADRVEISGKARDFQQLKALASTETGMRSEQVEKVRNQVEAGTYNADGKQIAEKMVRSTLLDEVL